MDDNQNDVSVIHMIPLNAEEQQPQNQDVVANPPEVVVLDAAVDDENNANDESGRNDGGE